MIEQIDYPEDHFDFALSSLMMHHLPDDLKKDGLQEVQRVLKPGGTLLVIDLDLSTYSLASLIHGHTSYNKLTPEIGQLSQYMDEAGYVSTGTGKLKFRGFSYIKGKKGDLQIQ